MLVEGKLEPLWFDDDTLPQALINIRQEPTDDNTDDDNDVSDQDDPIIEVTIYEDSDDEWAGLN